MGFFRDPTDMLFKHHNGQSIAPMDIPSTNLPDPQPSQFHVKSSSSSNIPTNQMIMDELNIFHGSYNLI
ncbi:hypothetical protein Lal_00035492 [Lupinus albus]|nr:hypothetical protein Lal_00035492 [Lupinus albus]